MKENAPEKSRANVLIILRHFQKWLTAFILQKLQLEQEVVVKFPKIEYNTLVKYV